MLVSHLDRIFSLYWGKENNRKRVICVQGPSTSGKSTISSKIEEILNRRGKKFFILHLDNYYKSLPVSPGIYDFDNPGALNWKNIFSLIEAIHNEGEYLEIYDYSYITSESFGPRVIKNPRPEYLIIEGIYSFYIFSHIFFDMSKYSPLRSNKDNEEVFVENSHSFPNFKVIKLLLTTSKKKMLETRIARDVSERNKTMEQIKFQILNQTWPATERWIYKRRMESDIVIENGIFNTEKMGEFLEALERYFVEEKKISDHCF